MNTPTQNLRQPANSRGLSIFLVAVAAGVGYFISVASKDGRDFSAALTQHIEERHCVLAQETGPNRSGYRHALLYRCDVPIVGEYVEAANLEAQVEGIRASHGAR